MRLAAVAAMSATLAAPAVAAVSTSLVASGFTAPLYLTGRGNDLFVVQQGGGIVRVDRTSGAQSNFFTVTGIETGGEKGLLGFAFDPGYAANGRFFVNVTTRISGQLYTEIRRYTDPGIATEASATVIRFTQPFDNHKGGWIDFGPDGNLYIATGDGGSGNDPQNNAQNLGSNLGKILRLDVSADAFPADPLRNYANPASNINGSEIFAYGLRNPFRDSFDRLTGTLWIGDVGQSAREEVDTIAAGDAGRNFGWRPLEGSIPTPGVGDPIPPGTTAPILEYSHAIGQSITGGYVFRGSNIADLSGRYVFGDFVAGKLFSAALDGGGLTDISSALISAINPSSFGEDADGNLYVVDYGGRVFRFFDPNAAAVPEPATWSLLIAGFAAVGGAARRRHARVAAPARSG